MPIVLVLAFYGCIGTDIVEELEVPADVSISRSVDSIQIGESFTFQADYFNMFNQKEEVSLNWSSSDPTIISVDDSGVARALMTGHAYIRASFQAVIDSIKVGVAAMVTEVPLTERAGVFMGNRDYTVNGGFVLREMGNELELALGADFSSSNGPGLYVYLSNSRTSVSGGVEVAKLRSNSGAQTYTIPMTEAQLNSYDFVLIYCKPFRIPFGIGTFN